MDDPPLIKAIVPQELLPADEYEITQDYLRAELKNAVGRLVIKAYLGGMVGYNPGSFDLVPLKTPFTAAGQWSELRIAGKVTDSIGYVFPLATLSERTVLPEEPKWPQVYASAAAYALVFTDTALHLVTRSPTSERRTDVHLSELFPPDMGVLVLGKQQLQAADIGWDALALMLHEHGFVWIPRETRETAETARQHQGKYSIKRLSPVHSDDAFQLLSMVASAHRESSAPARFLAHYQIIEHLSRSVFRFELSELTRDPSVQNDAWKVKTRLETILSQQHKLNVLRSRFLPGLSDHSSLNDLEDACQAFLKEVGEKDRDGRPSWGARLYAVRNIVVHGQVELMTGKGSGSLDRVCDCLARTCLDLLAYYRDP
ncbi:MAG: hypothetical protein AB1646_07940 [Thermodesulfobacteriota bacterium]